MKKSTPILIVMSLLLTIGVNAQNLSHHTNDYIIPGDRNQLVHSSVEIINVGTGTLNVKTYREETSMAAGHVAYFCWGVICYPPSTFVATSGVTMLAGDTNRSFIGYLDPAGNAGVSMIKYCFFDQNNLSDSVCMTFTYDITTGINELSNKATVSSAFPNPADGMTSLSYNLNSSGDARLVLYNMIGSVVKEIKLSERQGAMILATSDLKPGVYYYSLIADGKSSVSKKLVIAHH